MSKLTKLLNNPKQFFVDAVNKRIQQPEKPIETKAASKKAAPSSITHTIRMSKKIYHLIHTGENLETGSSHLAQWIPYFIQSNEEFIILTRNIELYNWVISKYYGVNVVYAKGLPEIESILNNLPFIRAIYYLSNTGNLIHTIRFNQYKHIFLGHGDSDKSASAHKFFKVYDEIWVAGQAHIDRFKNAGINMSGTTFVKVGRPMLKKVMKAKEKGWSGDKKLKPRLLYLPTWEGVYEEGNYSSVRLASAMLSEIHNRFGLKITGKFHPNTGKRDKILLDISEQIQTSLNEIEASCYIANKTVPVDELLMNNDIYICDISAVVSECISANGPIFVYIPKDKVIETSQSDMSYEDYAYTFSTIDELCTLLEQVLNGNDFKKEQRLTAMDYLCSIEQTKNNEFIRQLQEIPKKSPLVDTVRTSNI